jgi:O-antigen ligase
MSEHVAQRTILFGAAVLILLGLLFTRSRAGIGTGLVGLMLSAIVLVRARAASEGSAQTRVATVIVFGLVVAALLVAAVIGLTPVLNRWDAEDVRMGFSGRIALYGAVLQAALEFLPFGSGLSTFADVFPRFQAASGMGGFVDYAHNDYLQAFVELGLAAPIVVALLVGAFVSRMVELLWRVGGRSFTLLQLAAGVALVPLMLHSVFDFPLHIPANALWFATLAGVLFHRGVDPRQHAEPEVRKPARIEMPEAPPTISPADLPPILPHA